MSLPPKQIDEKTVAALQLENEKFNQYYLWLIQVMPPQFFSELGHVNLMLVVHNLMELDRQEYISNISLKEKAIIICLDQADTDLQILKNYAAYAITRYQTFISKTSPPFLKTEHNLRIVVAHFYHPDPEIAEIALDPADQEKLQTYLHQHHSEITDTMFQQALEEISPEMLRALPFERLAIVIKMFHRAISRDACQYEVQYNEEWELNKEPSMRITLAWKNIPKHNFLYRIIRTICRHNLVVKWMSLSHQNPYNINSVLVMAIDLHGTNNKPVWDAANMLDFVKDLITVKYFASFDAIDHYLVQKGVISGNVGNLLRAMTNFIHQALVHLDSHIYTLENIEEALCHHPELTSDICMAFKYRFDPDQHDTAKYQKVRENLLQDIEKLDTGHEENDIKRKNVLKQAVSFIHHTLKTNFYRPNYTSLSFRLNPEYLDHIPFDRTKKFPDLPYAIFFIKGMHFFGFHIRFRDLARGGLRTIYPEHTEKMLLERNNAFTECYNLALTQQLKNKDIPEGGAKAIIFLKPYERLDSETAILKRELTNAKLEPEEIERRIELFHREQRLEHLYQSQRAFIESLITLVNCDSEGKLRVRDIIDYWKKPEYLYLGPDENMHDSMIQWMAEYSKKIHYKPGSSFISGKQTVGINHKEYGVTSLGVNVFLDAVLRELGIDPLQDSFTIKMSGGPDGDVAGNEICNLQRYYPHTAKLIALTDVTGTIYDPKGLDLQILVNLFKQAKGIRFYPPQNLNTDGFLVDRHTRQYETPLVQHTLCWRKKEEGLVKDWLSGSDANYLLRHNVHQTFADIFIPGGGRPRTLNESNWTEFLDPLGNPTAKGIIEGANLYLDSKARRNLEERGTLVIKDSSANKTGVICSSFEVLCGLTLGDEKFIAYKPALVKEVLERLHHCAAQEAQLLLRTHRETGEYLTDLSNKVSRRINQFTDQLLLYLEAVSLPKDLHNPLIQSFLNYCLPTLRHDFQRELLEEIPDSHKKAIIACSLASRLVYTKGLDWFPSVVDILPMLLLQT